MNWRTPRSPTEKCGQDGMQSGGRAYCPCNADIKQDQSISQPNLKMLMLSENVITVLMPHFKSFLDLKLTNVIYELITNFVFTFYVYIQQI